MPTIKLTAFQIEMIGDVLFKDQIRNQRVDGLTQRKIRRIRKALDDRYSDIKQTKHDILKDLVKEGYVKDSGDGTPKVNPQTGEPVWENGEALEEADKRYGKIADEEYEIKVDYLLQEGDIRQLKLNGDEMDALSLVMHDEANVIDDDD